MSSIKEFMKDVEVVAHYKTVRHTSSVSLVTEKKAKELGCIEWPYGQKYYRDSDGYTKILSDEVQLGLQKMIKTEQ